MTCANDRHNPARRRYVWRVAAAMSLYLLTLLVANYAIDDLDIGGASAVLIVSLPALCVAALFWALGRLLVEERDEYLRSLLVRQMLVASGFSLTVATFWGFLEDFGLGPDFTGWYVAPLFFFGLGIGAVANRLTIGESGSC